MRKFFIVYNIDDNLIGKDLCGFKLFVKEMKLPYSQYVCMKDYFFETEAESSEILKFQTCMRLFKYSDICFGSGTFQLINNNLDETINICKEGGLYCWQNVGYRKRFLLEPNEMSSFAKFFDESKFEIPKINRMVEIYNSIYLTGMIDFKNDAGIKLLLPVIIFEIFANIEDGELKNRISRSVAVFLGKNYEESKNIYNDLSNIYKIRSKFVHVGNQTKIDKDLLYICWDYARRIIANLSIINKDIIDSYVKDNSLKSEEKEFFMVINKILNEKGFGDNPFKVEF